MGEGTLQTAPSPEWVIWIVAHFRCAGTEGRLEWSRLGALEEPGLQQGQGQLEAQPHATPFGPGGTCLLLSLSFPKDLRPSTVCSWVCEGKSIRKTWGHTIPTPPGPSYLSPNVLDSALSCSLQSPSQPGEGGNHEPLTFLLWESLTHSPLETDWPGPAGIFDARLDWADG